jgi:CRISPR-associated protein Cas2
MIIMILNNVPTGVRGDLTRWLIEVKGGVYVGQVSARIRDILWKRCVDHKGVGGVFQAWSTNNEQGFQMRMDGFVDRWVVNWEGVELIQETQLTGKEVSEVKKRHISAVKKI